MSFFTYSQDKTYIQSGDNTIHLTSYGQGQPILIINGGPGMNSEGFKALAQIIGKTNKAIIYDQRGTGESKIPNINAQTITMDAMVADIEVIRKHLGLNNWVILGHSFGGMLGAYYASKHPESIRGLILSSSGGLKLDLFSRIDITSKLTRLERDSLNYWNRKIANGDTTYLARLKRGTFLAPAYLFDKSNIPVVAERLTQGNSVINGLVWQNISAIAFDCTEGLKKIKVPVLIIQGKQDIIDLETAEVAKSALQNSELVILDNCSHYGWLDQPTLYFKHINSYLEKINNK
ncbi:alpha/beta fold hydrolase [Lacinutrix neustonica]|uniref:Alpha/beta fold hydrolase n=1 Tax=Lacinutrix neustonica TaxID=2980107 RepID=A0A9E8MWB8_9FLAO|nr:alpha/beta fold hydrolase [Lacinutrix neustonica]WAC02827.1 alpha/beta fold hydrolase [Lacinutrix neustonica]